MAATTRTCPAGAGAGTKRKAGRAARKRAGDRAAGDPWSFADVSLTAKVIGYVSLAMSQAEMQNNLF